MDRRTFLKTTTVAAAASTAAAGAAKAAAPHSSPATRAERHELHLAVPATAALADAARTLARDIQIASGGRIVLHCSEVTQPSLETIAAREHDGAFGHISEICNAPELALFSGLPGDTALSPGLLLTWLSAAGGEMHLEAAAAEYDLAAFVAGHSGPANGMWSNTGVADLRAFAAADCTTTGLGRRVTEIIRSAYQPTAENTPSARLIETGTAPLVAYPEVAEDCRRIWYRDGLHDQGHAYMLVIARRAWNELAPGDQLLIHTVSAAQANRDLATRKAGDRLMAPAVFASLPVARKPLPSDISAALLHTARKVVHDTMTAGTSAASPINHAYQAYQGFFGAMIGTPPAGPRPIS